MSAVDFVDDDQEIGWLLGKDNVPRLGVKRVQQIRRRGHVGGDEERTGIYLHRTCWGGYYDDWTGNNDMNSEQTLTK